MPNAANTVARNQAGASVPQTAEAPGFGLSQKTPKVNWPEESCSSPFVSMHRKGSSTWFEAMLGCAGPHFGSTTTSPSSHSQRPRSACHWPPSQMVFRGHSSVMLPRATAAPIAPCSSSHRVPVFGMARRARSPQANLASCGVANPANVYSQQSSGSMYGMPLTIFGCSGSPPPPPPPPWLGCSGAGPPPDGAGDGTSAACSASNSQKTPKGCAASESCMSPLINMHIHGSLFWSSVELGCPSPQLKTSTGSPSIHSQR
mmetsp:Transcript_24407/g.70608  ORF Transcript_24407/g.70608 Transcript_24407/m.70608 type:complete len:259 (+) Transcript_24407:392-1168(+)